MASLDGAVTLDGYSAGLSGGPDKRVFGLLRMLCDGLLVGAGTLRAEGYRAVSARREQRRAWRRARAGRVPPPWWSSPGRWTSTRRSAAFAEARRCARGAHPRRPGPPAGLADVAEVVACGETVVDLAAGLAELRGRGWPRCSARAGRTCSARSPPPTWSTSSA